MNQQIFENIKRRTGESINKQITKFDDRLYEIKADKPLKITWFQKVWRWVDGKKSIGGIGLMILGGASTLYPPLKLLGTGIFYAGSALASTGILHKLLKGSSSVLGLSTSEKGKFGLEEWLKLLIQILQALLKGLK